MKTSKIYSDCILHMFFKSDLCNLFICVRKHILDICTDNFIVIVLKITSQYMNYSYLMIDKYLLFNHPRCIESA